MKLAPTNRAFFRIDFIGSKFIFRLPDMESTSEGEVYYFLFSYGILKSSLVIVSGSYLCNLYPAFHFECFDSKFYIYMLSEFLKRKYK